MQLKLELLDGSKSISTLDSLHVFQIGLHYNWDSRRGSNAIIPILMMKPTVPAFYPPTRLFNLSSTRQEGNWTSDFEEITYWLVTYASCNIIAEADMDIMNLGQLVRQILVEYAQALWTKNQCCGPVCDEHLLEGPSLKS